ncbi:YfiR family protein [Paraneptunicella aestuarii]|uniref:YfiR family protein n=1 Tax=Paraneptunicella aestuarii TaxID=2831148 RepID=UPI001E556AC5|nr:YfiR family protein [Paraneptunicella aestuarii]UAA39031.1 YfiR family protein [Paraneptunicella aestuarii]
MRWKAGKQILLTITLLLLVSGVSAQHFSTEAKLKSAFIFNFSRLIDWPEWLFDKEKPVINICTLATDELNNILKNYQGRHSNDYAFNLVPLKSADNYQHCHLLYVDKEHPDANQYIKKITNTFGILLVSNIPNFSQCQGDIEITASENGKLSLIVNQLNTRKSGLKISSRILIRSKILQTTECPE